MENSTFEIVSLLAAAGGALGTLAGYNKLKKMRFEEAAVKSRAEDAVVLSNSEKAVVLTHDFARTIGYLGAHSIYGMIMYPLMPAVMLGNSFRDEFRRKMRNGPGLNSYMRPSA